MNKKSIQILKNLGFVMERCKRGVSAAGSYRCKFGKRSAELYSVGKDHFDPIHGRNVFIWETIGNTSITSYIRGTFRGYRCKRVHHDYDVGCIH
ncbi:MAG: hypothetical protein AABY22_29430, partial [Nanoarchaeota archaeon]